MGRDLVVLSGGLDSTVCMALAAAGSDGAPLALSFDYGQRHRVELDRAAGVAGHYRAEHLVVHLDTSAWGGSALTDDALDVPTGGVGDGIPVTYVPARNSIFLAVALGVVEGDPIAIRTPLIDRTKEEIVRLGTELDAPLHLTWSCYLGGDRPCGACDACRLRAAGFAAAAIEDPSLT